MTIFSVVIGAFSVNLCCLLVWWIISDVVGRRRVHRDNAQRHAEFVRACDVAHRDGTKPPFPPNRFVWE